MDIKTLIDNAEKIKDKGKIKRTSLTIKIKRFEELGFEDPTVVLEKPTSATILAALEKQSKYYQLSECMINPDLSNKDVQEAFKVNNKEALLKKIFTEEELDDLIMHVGKLNMTQNKAVLVSDIKN